MYYGYKFIISVIYLFLIVVYCNGKYTDHVVIHVDGNETVAQQLADHHFLKLIRRVFENENYYHFAISCNQTLNCAVYDQFKLKNDKRILWMERQRKKIRSKRHVKTNTYINRQTRGSDKLQFNDPYYPDQWYLHNEGQTGGIAGNDLNVIPVWKAGFTGEGVTVSVLDDGIQHTNLDIHQNYSPSISYDLVDLDDENHDPTPNLNGDNSHGTYCAGVIAAVANNSICGVGIAFHAKVGGLRLMDGKVTDLQEALAITFGLQEVDIYSASWGPKDDGKHMAGPGKLASKAFEKGIQKGRQGKGAIYVWAVGNGGFNQDNCNMDGYVTSIYTIAISALSHEGLSAYYSEACASTMASAFVGGPHSPKIHNFRAMLKALKSVKVVVPELDGKCTERFQGTSAAAPMAAGVIGLAIEANPSLTWRDVQHILVHSSRIPNAKEHGWKINGAGHHFHSSYGFGVIDAGRMVAKAQNWKLVGAQRKSTYVITRMPRMIKCSRNLSVTVDVTINKNFLKNPITHLEHVLITVDIIHPFRKYLSIYLQSPSGTLSQQLSQRLLDNRRRGIRMWSFMSVHFWDENPTGQWTLIISDHTPCNGIIGQIDYIALTLYGTFRKDFSHQYTLRGFKSSYTPNHFTLQQIMTQEKENSKSIKIKRRQI